MTSCRKRYHVFIPKTKDPDRTAFRWLLTRVNDKQAVEDAMAYYEPPPRWISLDLRWSAVRRFAEEFHLKVPEVTTCNWRDTQLDPNRESVIEILSDFAWVKRETRTETPFAILETAAYPDNIIACYDLRDECETPPVALIPKRRHFRRC